MLTQPDLLMSKNGDRATEPRSSATENNIGAMITGMLRITGRVEDGVRQPKSRVYLFDASVRNIQMGGVISPCVLLENEIKETLFNTRS